VLLANPRDMLEGYKDKGYTWDPDNQRYVNHAKGTSIVRQQWNIFHAHTSTEPHHTNAVLNQNGTNTRNFRTLDQALDHLDKKKK
jgi:hypothetical protein